MPPGSGSDIWNGADAFNYSYTNIRGDHVLITRVSSLENTSGWAKAGPMFRASTEAASAYVAVERTPSNGIHLQARTTGGASAIDVAGVAGITPAWLKLARSGTQFTAWYATTAWLPVGSEWKQVGLVQSSAFGTGEYLGGLAVCSGSSASLGTATFCQTALIGGPTVSSFAVNDGSAQRSMVRELTLSFSATGNALQCTLAIGPWRRFDCIYPDRHRGRRPVLSVQLRRWQVAGRRALHPRPLGERHSGP